MSDVPVVKGTPTEAAGVQVVTSPHAPSSAGGGTVVVVAPTDLQAGYPFQVSLHGSTVTVMVPPGGVQQGQTFTAQIKEQPNVAGTEEDPSNIHYIPTGRWRDELCDCFQFGCCHPVCCLGFWLEPVLLGQVMTRMSRNWCGGPGPSPSASNTCKVVTGIFIFCVVAQFIIRMIFNSTICSGAQWELDPETQEEVLRCPDGSTEEVTTGHGILGLVYYVVGYAFAIYMICAICNTRRAIRNKYNIRPGCCGECDDFCCSLWCSCCAVQQMARHTNDYNQYDVQCCSSDCFNKRGQQAIVPEIV